MNLKKRKEREGKKVNKIVLIGRLTRNPESGVTNANIPYTRMTLAVDRVGTDTTDFIDCIAWRKTAELIDKFCSKGDRVGIMGNLQINTYENLQGEKRKSADVVINDIEFLTPKEKKQIDTSEDVPDLDPLDETKPNDDLPF